MTSHKEQPAVDTSAEKLLALAGTWETAASLPNPDAHSDLTPEIAVKTIALLKAELAKGAGVLRSLAAHPAEPAGMELETTAEELAEWDRLAEGAALWSLSGSATRRLIRDCWRLKADAQVSRDFMAVSDARAEKVEANAARLKEDNDFLHLRRGQLAIERDEAENKRKGMHRACREAEAENETLRATLATCQQPVGDEEVEAIVTGLERMRAGAQAGARGVDARLPSAQICEWYRMADERMGRAAGLLHRLVRERDALSTQLRDAQARSKGMEEAIKSAANQQDGLAAEAEAAEAWERYDKHCYAAGVFRQVSAALSRPEGSAS